jgi:pimeloyl-ACP methyl ester carboxylesterase
MDNANSWQLLGPALACRNARVVALDLPGHGRSPHAPSSAEYSQIEHAYAAYDALDALGWLCPAHPPSPPPSASASRAAATSRAAVAAAGATGGDPTPASEGETQGFSLLGHSMGGGVACLLASALPEHVHRLALVEGFGPLAPPVHTFPLQLRDAIRKRHAAAVGEAAARERTYGSLEDAASTRVNGAKRLPGDQFMSTHAALALASRGTEPAKAAAGASKGGFRFSHDRRLAHPNAHAFHEEQVLAALHAICCPTMLVQAANGWPRPEPGFSTRVRSMQPGLLELVDLAHGSHYAHLDPETAEAVQRALVPFLCESTSALEDRARAASD